MRFEIMLISLKKFKIEISLNDLYKEKIINIIIRTEIVLLIAKHLNI